MLGILFFFCKIDFIVELFFLKYSRWNVIVIVMIMEKILYVRINDKILIVVIDFSVLRFIVRDWI